MRKSNPSFNLLPTAEDYFETIFNEAIGMKTLILDEDTSGIISIIYTQSKLYKHDIYLIKKIDEVTEKLGHLKAIYFIRPTPNNFQLLSKELKDPRFYEYHIFFTNEISTKTIEELANSDTGDRIKNIQEIYLDYYALSRNVFSLNIPCVIGLTRKENMWNDQDRDNLNRMTEGLVSTLMSLRLMPEIRYLNGSSSCSMMANKIKQKMESELREKQSDYLLEQRAILLLTERKEDVVTPLLTPWTYLAMIHEFLGISNNKIDIVNKQKAILNRNSLNETNNISMKEKEEREFVLSELNDEFYRKNVFMGFGELANNLKSFITEVSTKRNKNIKLDSLEDMHEALDKVPELNALSTTLQKHVTLSCSISDQIEKSVFEVSRVEQDLVCQDNRNGNIEGVWKILRNEKVEDDLKFKLVLLFSIKYPNDKETKEFLIHLEQLKYDKSQLRLVSLLAAYQTGHKSDLFHLTNIKKKAKSYFDRMLKDVPNVYTQHKPYLFEEIIPDLINEKLKETDYPIAMTRKGNNNKMGKPVVIVFVVGGITYTEAKEADEFEGAKVIVGGSFVHNSKTFIREVMQLENVNEEN